MNLPFVCAFAVMLFSAAALIWVYLSGSERRTAARRLVRITQHRAQPAQINRERGRLQIEAFLDWFRTLRRRWGLGAAEEESLQARLARAGYRDPHAHDFYLAGRTLVPIAAFLIASLVPMHRGFWMVLLPGITYLLPDITLRRIIRVRRQKIARSLPDAVDLLVICVEAGLGIDQAVGRVSQELHVSHPEVTEEFVQVNLEQRAGKRRLMAWQAMAERADLPEVSSFVNMLIETERFGTPIARALSTFANGMREKRGQLAEELAAKTTVKIIFPLVLFIFPSIFIVLLGPAALTLMHNFVNFAH